MASVELHDVTVRRNGVTVLRSIELDVADGEFVGVVGPSGAGKTTLLRAIAGLDTITEGRLVIAGADVTRQPPSTRDTAMVFQNPALLPHRSVRRNVAFPLEVRHHTIEQIRTRVDAEARALHIESLLERDPATLAAGEAQLVQIARALVRVPSVLLLDEPLARLDAAIRQRMRAELRVLQRGYAVTTLFTTNDPVEAMAMPDRVVVLADGRIAQVGAPLEIYRDPESVPAALATGHLDLSNGVVVADASGCWLVPDTERGTERERAWQPSLAGYVGTTVVYGRRSDAEPLLVFDATTGRRIR